jgi:hypothetical protein
MSGRYNVSFADLRAVLLPALRHLDLDLAAGAFAERLFEQFPLAHRTVEQDETRRRRKCDACGHRFTTREITDERLDWLRRAAAVLRKKVRDALEPT